MFPASSEDVVAELQKLTCPRYAVIVDDMYLSRETLVDPHSSVRTVMDQAQRVVAIPSVKGSNIPSTIADYLSEKCGLTAISSLDMGIDHSASI